MDDFGDQIRCAWCGFYFMPEGDEILCSDLCRDRQATDAHWHPENYIIRGEDRT